MHLNNYFGLSKILISIPMLILAGCISGNDYLSKDRLIDYYYLYEYSDNLYSVECKLGCDTDKSVEGDIKKVWVDDSFILIEVKGANKNACYFLIISNKENLKCCNNNLLFEAQSISEADSVLSLHNLSRNYLDV